MKKKSIAILGATSHIAKGLIYNFLRSDEFKLHLFGRSPEKARGFVDSLELNIGKKDDIVYEELKSFPKFSYGAIINCVGTGTFKKMRGDFTSYFTTTEEYDNSVISYLQGIDPRALYINFSSGAVYGRNFSAPVDENTANSIKVNHVAAEDYYSIAKLNSEAKHRAFGDLNIVDIRLFSYFSRFIDLEDGYFITELLSCILHNTSFITDEMNFIRDYVGPEDLFLMIKKCLNIKKINAAFDVVSAGPVEKKEILDYFVSEYGLKIKIDAKLNYSSPTGSKNVYYSKYANAASIGYKPEFSSLETIKKESKFILNK